MNRKGFPESYDLRRLLVFLAKVKSGAAEVRAPVYSLVYDIVPGEETVISRPDIVLLEGLNVLQTPPGGTARGAADVRLRLLRLLHLRGREEEDILAWFTQRFLKLRQTAFRDPTSFFRQFAALSESEAKELAHKIWQEINGPNLRENIMPTRERARLVLRQGSDHGVAEVRLRRL